jgi:uncharacterized oligopeptide transporter (OPT) family protein
MDENNFNAIIIKIMEKDIDNHINDTLHAYKKAQKEQRKSIFTVSILIVALQLLMFVTAALAHIIGGDHATTMETYLYVITITIIFFFGMLVQQVYILVKILKP